LFAIIAVSRSASGLPRQAQIFGVFGQIDQLLAYRQVRVVSSLQRRAARLLSAFLFGRRLIPRIVEVIGAISGGLLLGLLSEAFGLELTNFRLGGSSSACSFVFRSTARACMLFQ